MLVNEESVNQIRIQLLIDGLGNPKKLEKNALDLMIEKNALDMTMGGGGGGGPN